MGNLMKTEWYKLRKDRIFWVLTLLLIAVSIVMPLEKVGRSINMGENEFYIGYALSINIEIVVRTVPCILAGFFISSEYSMGTMKSMVSSGNSRVRIYFAKLVMFSIGTIVISLILPIFMTGAGAIFLGASALPTGTYFLQTIGLIALYAASFASIMTFFAAIFTDSGKTIGFLIFFFVLLDTILEMIAGKISFLQIFVDWSVTSLLFNVYNINILDSGEVFKLVAAPIVTLIVFTILGCIVFKKKEIK